MAEKLTGFSVCCLSLCLPQSWTHFQFWLLMLESCLSFVLLDQSSRCGAIWDQLPNPDLIYFLAAGLGQTLQASFQLCAGQPTTSHTLLLTKANTPHVSSRACLFSSLLYYQSSHLHPKPDAPHKHNLYHRALWFELFLAHPGSFHHSVPLHVLFSAWIKLPSLQAVPHWAFKNLLRCCCDPYVVSCSWFISLYSTSSVVIISSACMLLSSANCESPPGRTNSS